ncbi:MAG: hypothetical protein LQ348_007441 [Seirophora lacunosa]|nr:MAG: hypothetical protein LQ348_007441 [Seirophora lacunosa]
MVGSPVSSFLDMKVSSSELPRDLEGSSRSPTIVEPRRGSVTRYFNSNLSSRNTEHILLLCWFITGLIDSTIFNAYRTFVSMQTGNTMFLGIGSANFDATTRPYGWAKSLTSLVCFVLGAIFFSRFGTYFQASRRGTLSASFLIQAAIILLCAILVQTDAVEGRLEYIGENIDWIHIIPIALLSFQAPGQVWLSRELQFAEVSTVVVSTMLYDFGSDPDLFRKGNGKRSRRMLGFCALLVGAIVGGWITKKTGHITVPMWVAGCVKLGIAGAWVVWPAEKGVRWWGC